MNDYRLESPPILRDFLSYHETIKAHSQKTVDEYFLDLRNFFRYLKQSHDPSLRDLPLSEISIMDVDLDFVKKVTLTDIYAYMTYLSRDRVQHQNSDVSDYGLNAASRARKIATIRSFYNYLVNKAHLLDTNPCKDLDSPKIKKSLPKYLTLDESVQLLQSVDGQNRELQKRHYYYDDQYRFARRRRRRFAWLCLRFRRKCGEKSRRARRTNEAPARELPAGACQPNR